MSPLPQKTPLYVGWDVGGWNCDKNARSRDAIVILGSDLNVVGRPWRGNLRTTINESIDAADFVRRLWTLCVAGTHIEAVSVTLAIDTPLGFPVGFTALITGSGWVDSVGSSATNPYLFRKTERYLCERGKRPLSPVKDMIGSQATKGMHILAKFAPKVSRCGVWTDGESLTAIEAYPAACKQSIGVDKLRQRVDFCSDWHQDVADAITCALLAYLFAVSPDELIAPGDSVPQSEGWIWIPKDFNRPSQ